MGTKGECIPSGKCNSAVGLERIEFYKCDQAQFLGWALAGTQLATSSIPKLLPHVRMRATGLSDRFCPSVSQSVSLSVQ